MHSYWHYLPTNKNVTSCTGLDTDWILETTGRYVVVNGLVLL